MASVGPYMCSTLGIHINYHLVEVRKPPLLKGSDIRGYYVFELLHIYKVKEKALFDDWVLGVLGIYSFF